MTASQRIRYIIKFKNFTVENFAEKIGTSRGTLNQMFKNDSNPKLPLLQACLKIFPDLNPRWLITGEGNPWLPKIESDPSTHSEVELPYVSLKNRVKEMEDLMSNVVLKMEKQVEESFHDIKDRIEKLENSKKKG